MTTNSLALYDDFNKMMSIASALASSDLVPQHFQKKPANVLIALEFAHRNDIAPFAAMQSLFIIQGKVGMSATMAISLARKWNVFTKLQYEVTGKDDDLKVKAIATLHDGEKIDTEVSMKMAITAGWAKNPTYKSIPEQMLKYRAATFLIRSHFPEVLFGMQTIEEISDVEYAKKAHIALPTTAPTIDVKPIEVIDEVIESKPEPKIETPERDIEDMRGEVREFLETRPDAWFERIGKERVKMIEMVDNERDPVVMKAILAKTLQYDKQASV
jgi:hypothetical protein